MAAAICGIAVIALTDSGSNTEPDASRSDPSIEYPEALSGLPFPPGALAIDPNNGDLWFIGLASDRTTTELFRYSGSDGTLQRRALPIDTVGLYTAMAVDSRGHLILAQGGFVLDVDPAGGYVEYEPPPGGYFTDIAMSDDGKAYVSKEYAATIIEIDLLAGEITEHPLPASMSLVHHIALAGDRLWMAAPFSTEDLSAQTAVLDLTTGETEVIELKVSALAADGQGRVFVSRQVEPAVVAVDEGDATLEAGALDLHERARWVAVEPGSSYRRQGARKDMGRRRG